ncbi:MAG: TerC family protein [Pirellulaceae bacterium]
MPYIHGPINGLPAEIGEEMTYFVWISFLVFILLMVLLDLGVFHRRAHEVRVREALAWTGVWVALAMIFNVVVYFLYERSVGGWASLEMHQLSGREAATQFFTGYVLEKSLSVDNIFVIAMIFAYFGVPLKNQHRLLFWGIMGAVVLRGVMIALGAALIARFDWIVYVFGGLLLVSAAKMMITQTENIDPEKNVMVRLVRRLYPVTPEIESGRFFVKLNGQWAATPLFLALILIETSDILFAVDSIPAVFAVTRDPFLVFTSNIFAILGLRSMYFVLAGFMHQFRYLKTSLVFVLAYVGVKMMVSHHYPIPNLVSLAFIGGILAVGVLASLVASRREATRPVEWTVPGHEDRSDPSLDVPTGPAEIPERPAGNSQASDEDAKLGP